MSRIATDPVRSGRGLAAACATVALIAPASGCGTDEPRIASDVPQIKVTPAPDPKAPRPKGMPRKTSAGVKLDPATGRPVE